MQFKSWLSITMIMGSILLQVSPGKAQTVLMHQMSSIKVRVPYPGLTISVVRGMDFGKIIRRSGFVEITRADSTAGRVTLTGVYRYLPIYVSVKPPAFIAGDEDSIAYTGGAAINEHSENPATAEAVSTSPNNLTAFRLAANRENWTGFAFLYFFGRLELNHKVKPGYYSGAYEITLIL